MKVLIVGILVLALAVAGVSTYLIQTFSGEENIEELQKVAQEQKVRVLIATKALKAGDILNADAVRWQIWVEDAMNPQFVAVQSEEDQAERMTEFQGAVVRNSIAQGEPILASKVFKKGEAGFLASVLKEGMRAVTFTASPTTASGGFVLPGDRVDVLLTHDKVSQALRKKQAGKKKDPDEPLTVLSQTTETIMHDLLVLAVDTLVSEPTEGANTVAAKTITLELTPKQAEALITARTMGKISLVLRSLRQGDDGDPTKPSFTTDVQVSPFISNMNAILEAHGQGKTDALEKQIKQLADENKDLERAIKEGRQPAKKPSRSAAEKRVIKIYRGGGAATEEVTVK